MTPNQTDQAAQILRILRPDWTRQRIGTVLDAPLVQAQNPRTVLAACVLVATDPRATAPGYLLTDAATWATARTITDPDQTRRPQPPRSAELCQCGRHLHQPDPVCDQPQPASRHRPATPEFAQAAIDQARANLRRSVA